MAYEHIEKLVLDRGESYKDFAQKILGRTQAVATNFFQGKRSLQIEEVAKVCEHYGVSAHYVIYGEEMPMKDELRASEIAIMQAIKDIVTLIGVTNPLALKMLHNVFNFQKTEYGRHGPEIAHQVMEKLTQFADDTLPLPERQLIETLLHSVPAGSA